MSELITRWKHSFIGNYGTPDIQIVSGSGVYVKDSNNKKYLDLVSGIAVSSLGHSHPAVVKAIKVQSKKLIHTSNLYINEPSLKLAEKLQSLSKRKSRIFFCNSGAEANEAALKITRLNKSGLALSLENSFHGRTFGALSLTGQKAKQAGFEPLVPGIEFLQANQKNQLANFQENEVSSLFFEPIQGEGGVVDLDFDFLESLKVFTKEKNAYLVADEVQTGIGRSGYWFMSESLGLDPDVIVLAKGLAAGLPIGAIMVFGDLVDGFSPGTHGSTFGGNPLSSAVAFAVIETIEKYSLLENSRLRGEEFVRNLSGHKAIKKISGSGLLRGIYLQLPVAKQVVAKAQESGLLLNALSDSIIRIAPPLIIKKKQIDIACEIIDKALDTV
ncbi:MAG: acetylornithine transaminase [Candidatus Nanopelagicales bacterium]